MLRPVPIGWREAAAFIDATHRHHKRPQGWKWGIGVEATGKLVGVACVGRPVSRMIQEKEPRTCEVIRLCTDGTRNACSFLYSRSAQAARVMGWHRIITYILASESGISLRASGWECVGQAGGGEWSRPSRVRVSKAPTETKVLWHKVLLTGDR